MAGLNFDLGVLLNQILVFWIEIQYSAYPLIITKNEQKT